jgi:plastocyanin
MKPCLPGRVRGRRKLLVALLATILMPGASAPAFAGAKPRYQVITIEAMRFSPGALEVNVGDTVVWKNKDPFPHNVVADGNAFHSADIQADGSWSFKPAKAGQYPYVCSLHPGMRGMIVVKTAAPLRPSFPRKREPMLK